MNRLLLYTSLPQFDLGLTIWESESWIKTQVSDHSPWDATFGALEDRGSQSKVSTLYINDTLLSNDLYLTHDYFGCIHKDVALKHQNDSISTDISVLAVYFSDTRFVTARIDVNTFQFRLWDFSPDCHTNLYKNSTYPVGMDFVESYGVGVAIYCSKVRSIIYKDATVDFRQATPWCTSVPPLLLLHSTGGPPLVRSPLVRFPLVRNLEP